MQSPTGGLFIFCVRAQLLSRVQLFSIEPATLFCPWGLTRAITGNVNEGCDYPRRVYSLGHVCWLICKASWDVFLRLPFNTVNYKLSPVETTRLKSFLTLLCAAPWAPSTLKARLCCVLIQSHCARWHPHPLTLSTGRSQVTWGQITYIHIKFI